MLFCHCEERQRTRIPRFARDRLRNLTYSVFNQRLLRRTEYGTSRNDIGYLTLAIYIPLI